MLVFEAPPLGGRAAFELHFQPPAGNEVLKEFQLKLTPMGIAYALTVCCIQKRTAIETRKIFLNIAEIVGEKAMFCFHEGSNRLHYAEYLDVTVC
ncbi:hypothetical protein FD723_13055 [Nostoc sp. C052]|uniref:hypothetical protein n=1 Tax=Nostoc sp. C052 TaxID=2576902 RepID=UPI0015C3DB2F|nr:hypothetical protein [Nostoc sp. C052]QLE41270.1 hypothetical protein FD723_13055 [Nostoc sp. C052]